MSVASDMMAEAVLSLTIDRRRALPVTLAPPSEKKGHHGASPQHDGLGHWRRRLYRQLHGSCARRCWRAVGGARQSRHGFDWALARGAVLVISDCGDQPQVSSLIAQYEIDAIVHFAASIVVRDSVRDPLGYYRKNTVNSRALIEAAVRRGVRHFIFSSTAAVYGNPSRIPVHEDDPTVPTSPPTVRRS